MANGKKNKKGKGKRGSKNKVSKAWVAPFPPMMVRQFRYVENVTMTEGAAGGGYVHVWTPSSMFDPNNTGSGHQYMFYDQLLSSTGPYTRYRALATKVTVTFTCLSAQPCIVGVFASSSLSGPASYVAALEKPWCKWVALGGNVSGKPVARVSLYVPHAPALGITERHLRDDDNYAGYYNSSPGINLAVMTFVYGQGASVASCAGVVEFDTRSELFSLANTGTS